MSYAIVVIGTSWGGLDALGAVVSGLSADFPVPLIAVQHRAREARALLAQLLGTQTTLEIVEAEDKDPLVPGRMYIAPADYHLLVEDGFVSLDIDEHVRFSRPSIDVTFASAAETYGARAIGVVLTGANADGAAGLQRIVGRGGVAIVEDPESALSATMPAAALRAVPGAKVLPLERIAPYLRQLAGASAASTATATAPREER